MRNMRVFIVDDEVPIRQSLKLFPWNQNGYDLVGEAKNGKEALHLSMQVKPDIVITDIVMPVMDGLKLTQSLKEWSLQVQIILLTCHNDFDYVRQALVLGANDYLLKGVYREEDLLKTLNNSRAKIKEEGIEENFRFEIHEAIAYINDHIHESFQMSDVANYVGLSPNYLGILFRREKGAYFQDYVKKVRMEKAASLLRHSHLKVYEISEKVGIPNYRYFTELFYNYFKQTPKEYRGSKCK
jgi:two-component system response regulator YesN